VAGSRCARVGGFGHLSVHLVFRSLLPLSVPTAWLDDVAHPDGPLTCHVVARVGACGAAGVVGGRVCLLAWVVRR
jgi:hypothetical protein